MAGPVDPRLKGIDWGGDPNAGLLRYARNDRDEPKKSNPELLGVLEDVLSKDGRLGKVADYLETVLPKFAKKATAQVVFDLSLRERLLRQGEE